MKPTWNLALRLLVMAALSSPRLLRGAEEEPTAAPPAGSAIDGTWRWTFTMPDGTTSPIKLALETADGHLTGSTSFRAGTEATITNAVLNGDQLRFQVLRRRGEREIVTTYSGTWNRNQIVGTVESNWTGEIQRYPWTAIRPHEGVEGTWKWAVSVRGRKFEARVKLEQDGELLTGTVPGAGRGGRRVHISNGSFKKRRCVLRD